MIVPQWGTICFLIQERELMTNLINLWNAVIFFIHYITTVHWCLQWFLSTAIKSQTLLHYSFLLLVCKQATWYVSPKSGAARIAAGKLSERLRNTWRAIRLANGVHIGQQAHEMSASDAPEADGKWILVIIGEVIGIF